MIIETRLRPITWLPGCKHGYACGYVGVPPEHPWYGKHYNSIHDEYPELDVHGGLTFSGNEFHGEPRSPLWWVGFDTCHSGDTIAEQSKVFCEHEVAKLKKFAESLVS